METTAGLKRKSVYWFILIGLFVMIFWGCGPETEEESTTTTLSDDFSSYSTFPETPWSVISGDSSNWTITSSSNVYAAHYYTTSANHSYLLNSDFSGSGNTSVSAKLKIVSVAATGGEYGLYLRTSGDLTSCYQLIFDTVNERIYLCRATSGLATVLNWATWSVSTDMTSYHTYKFKLYNNDDDTVTLSVYIDGSLMMSAIDSSPLTNGYYTGFFFYHVLDGYIASYQITQP